MTAARAANHMRLQAALAAGKVGKPKGGTVTDYDPDTYSAKVMLQPEGIETGWLPIETAAAGPSWGIYAGPINGAQALVSFLEGDREIGWITGFLASDQDPPPKVADKGPPAGEYWVFHKSGSLMRFTNDGDVVLTTQRDLLATVGRDLTAAVTRNITSSAAQWNHTGPVSIDGTLHVTQAVTFDAALDVAGNVTFTGSSVTHGGVNIGKTHIHGGVTAGGANTAVPH